MEAASRGLTPPARRTSYWNLTPGATGGPPGAVNRMSDVFLFGLLGSQFLANYLATVHVRR